MYSSLGMIRTSCYTYTSHHQAADPFRKGVTIINIMHTLDIQEALLCPITAYNYGKECIWHRPLFRFQNGHPLTHYCFVAKLGEVLTHTTAYMPYI